jgi:hypothetical protein
VVTLDFSFRQVVPSARTSSLQSDRHRMNTRRTFLLAATHSVCAVGGFAAGVYALPILVAPDGPTATELAAVSGQRMFTGTFRRNLKDSDALHWGEGTVSIAEHAVSLEGQLSPGPDYKLYLSPEFVETEADFKRLKAQMARVGDIKTFKNFVVPLPSGIDPAQYTSVIVWCERFSEFITAARYR